MTDGSATKLKFWERFFLLVASCHSLELVELALDAIRISREDEQPASAFDEQTAPPN